MIAALKYLVEMFLCSGIFVLLYKGLVEGRVSHRGSRIYLIVSTLASVLVPLLEIPIWPAQMLYMDLDLTVNMPEEIEVADLETVHRVVAGTEAAKDNTWIIPALYSAVAGISLLIALIGIILILRFRRGASVVEHEDYTLVENENITSPFSFIRTIFIGSGTPSEEKDIIITHERSHIIHGHSYERLFMKFMTSVFWINPFIHMNARYLEEVHEWQADSDVLGEGYNLGLYRSIIFKQLFGYCPEVSSGLKNSITKKRFLMMDTKLKKFGSLRLAAALVLLSGTGLLFGATARPFVEPELSASRIVADSVKTLLIEITDQGETITMDGGFTLDDDWKLDPDQTVIIKADPDVKMGYITDIKQKLRKAGVTKVRYQMNRTSGSIEELSFVDQIYFITAEPKNMIFGMDTSKGEAPSYASVTGEIREETDADCFTLLVNALRKKPDVRIVHYGQSIKDDKGYLLISAAYRQLREEYSEREFGKALDELNESEMAKVSAAIPSRIIRVGTN